MTTYQIDGTVVDTDNALAEYVCADTIWDGNNHRCRITGEQWHHQTLYQSKKGRWYVVFTSQWQGVIPHAEWVTEAQAAAWLILNGDPLPDELEPFADEASE